MGSPRDLMFSFKALLVISACLFGAKAYSLPVPLTSSDIAPSIVRRDACSSTPAWAFDDAHHFTRTLPDAAGASAGRTYLVHSPASLDNTRQHALVLSFHGYSGDADKQEGITHFSDQGVKIDGKGIFAVYGQAELGPGKPGEGPTSAWEGAPYSPPGVDDVAYVSAILDDVLANVCIDPNRIYITGMSNGGGFTNLLACSPSVSSRIAAFGSNSAALYPPTHSDLGADDCPLPEGRKGLPYISLHGYDDTTIPYNGRSANGDGDTAYATPDIGVWRKDWAAKNGCARDGDGSSGPSPTHVTHPYTGTTRYEWDCPGAQVVGYKLDHLGHEWVNNPPQAFSGSKDAMIPFFQANPLNATQS